MLAYFTASIVGKKYHLAKYEKILEILKHNGVKVISDHIIKVSEKEINLQTKEIRLKFHDQLERWISSCDFMIVETSFPSVSVGYEIALGLNLNKPILVLYSEGDAPSLIAHHENEKLVCEKYDMNNLEDMIKDFIQYAKGGSDSRFTFFLNSTLARHLEKEAALHKMPKSVYLRSLIERDLASK